MFKPMLACEANLENLNYPVVASPKFDGIRAIVINGVVMSRKLKPIPNRAVQEMFKHLEHHDGELIVGDPTDKAVYRNTMSGVMSQDGRPDVEFYAFDHIEEPNTPWQERTRKIATKHLVDHTTIYTKTELLEYEDWVVGVLGYEGVMLRSLNAPYKFGRSTAREGYLQKFKRFVDGEYVVHGFNERQHNGNELQTNELGYAKRTSHKENKTGRGDLGSITLAHGDGIVFTCGTGFTDEERVEIWNNREKYLGKIAKIKYLAVGMKDAPRHPVFLGWRSTLDL